MEINDLLEIAKKGSLTDCGQRKCAEIIEAQQHEINKFRTERDMEVSKTNKLYAEIRALTADKDEQAGRMEQGLRKTKEFLDLIYPADIFTGESGVEGVLMVVELRKAIDALLGGKEDA